MAAGAAPTLEPRKSKNESEQTQFTKANSIKEWLIRKLDEMFEHYQEYDTYFGL